jgi:hypothetical protein
MFIVAPERWQVCYYKIGTLIYRHRRTCIGEPRGRAMADDEPLGISSASADPTFAEATPSLVWTELTSSDHTQRVIHFSYIKVRS